MTLRKVLAGLHHVQMFPTYIMHFLPNMFGDLSSLEKERQTPLNKWLSTWRGMFYQMKINLLFAAESNAIRIAMEKTGISHPDTGLKWFAV